MTEAAPTVFSRLKFVFSYYILGIYENGENFEFRIISKN